MSFLNYLAPFLNVSKKCHFGTIDYIIIDFVKAGAMLGEEFHVRLLVMS